MARHSDPFAAIHRLTLLLNVQKIEKEKGFSAVFELLSCGKKEGDNANYFKALEKIAGINKSDFNSNVVRMVREN